MKLVYEGKDITDSVEMLYARISDRHGGVADSIEIILSDKDKLWQQWNPEFNDKIRIIENGFDSGIMFVDETICSSGRYQIKAKSLPANYKTNNYKFWETISFKELAQSLASELGFSAEFYSIDDYTYKRLDMIDNTNIKFLNEMCTLEGYSLKISNGKIIVYNENRLDRYPSVKSIANGDFIGEPVFKKSLIDSYRKCIVKSYSNSNELIMSEFEDTKVIGSTYTYYKTIGSKAEADRYCKNILRFFNKNIYTGYFSTKLDTTLAAGNVINIDNFYNFSGKYFITEIEHILSEKLSRFKVRKVLEGY